MILNHKIYRLDINVKVVPHPSMLMAQSNVCELLSKLPFYDMDDREFNLITRLVYAQESWT